MQEKTKVVYIVNATDLFGGATKSLLALLDGVSKNGIEPIVVMPCKDGLYNEVKHRGYKAIYAPVRPKAYSRIRTFKALFFVPLQFMYWLYLNHKAVCLLYNLLKNEHIDIIHTNVSVIDVGMRLAEKLKVHHVMHFREYGDLDFGLHYFPSKAAYMRRFYKIHSYAIAITQGVLAHHNLSNYERASVVYNGIINGDDIRIMQSTKAYYFLYAGRICPEKGLMHLVAAYCDYAKSIDDGVQLPLWVAGSVLDEEYTKNIKLYIDEQRQQDNIVFLGARDDIQSLMRNARALIIPSEMEGFGRCMAEAMSVGCLCIGHDTGGTKEQFDNGVKLMGKEIGLRYTTEEQLAKCLIEVAEMPEEKYSEITTLAATTVSKLYSVETCVYNVYKLYERIISDKNNKICI